MLRVTEDRWRRYHYDVEANKVALEIELKFFEQHRKEWLEHHAGKYALVKGEELRGVYDTQEAAYAEGVATFGIEPFLIKQVLPEDEVHHLPAYHLGLMHAVV